MRWNHASLVALLPLTVWGCTESHSMDAGSDGSPARADAGDAGHDFDARVRPCDPPLECIGPPLGCRYLGGDGCSSCGTIVCPDGGGATQLDASADASLMVSADGSVDASDASNRVSDASTGAQGACSPGASACGQGYSCCYPCGIPGCSYQCTPSCTAGTPACYNGCRAVP